MTILEKARSGALTQPQQHGFSFEDWVKALAELDQPSLEDSQLVLSAFWFNKQLSNLREMLEQTAVEHVPKALRIRCTIAIANRELVVLSQKTQPRVRKTGNEPDSVSIDLMRGERVTASQTDETFTPDEIGTTIIDLLPYPLDQAINAASIRQKTKTDANEQLARISKAINIANTYHVLVDYWLACLWRGWTLVPKADCDFFVPSDVDEAKRYAASEYRQECWKFADAVAVRRIWSSLDEHAQKQANNKKIVLGVRKKNNAREFVVRRPKINPNQPPYWFELASNLPDGIVDSLFDRPFPRKPSLTLESLMHAWEILRSLVQVCLDLNAKTSASTIESLRKFEITFKLSELRNVFSRCFDGDVQLAEDCIDFLSYQPRSQNVGGLWARPLVQFGDGKFAVAAAPLLIGNPMRCIEFWLRLGGVKLEERGAAFETSVRENVAEGLKNSQTLRDAAVHFGSLELGMHKEEIDLVFRIGKTVFVGEVKCHVFPSDPIEVHNYLHGALDEAANQAQRKADAARKEKEALESLFSTSLGSGLTVKVVPLVVTNLALGAGSSRFGVPILDIRFLNQYLKRGYFDFQTTVSADGTATSEDREYLYRSANEAEQHCLSHFLNQPVLRRFIEATVKRSRPIPTFEAKPAGWVYYEVDGAVLHDQTFR